MAAALDEALAPSGRRCLLCCGHGAVSVLNGGRLETYGTVERYRPERSG